MTSYRTLNLLATILISRLTIGCGGLDTSVKTDCSGPGDCIDGYECINSICVSNHSPVDGSKDIQDLSADEVQQFCEWAFDVQGGNSGPVDCGQGVTRVPGTVEKCTSELQSPYSCQITVGQMEKCAWAMGDDLCSHQDTYEAHADCAPLRQCFSTVKGTVRIADAVACGATPADDCKGTLMVAILNGPQQSSEVIKRDIIQKVDMSTKTSLPFEFSQVPIPSQKLYLVAALLETYTYSDDFVFPAVGDIGGVLEELTLKPEDTTTVDVTLDERLE